MLSVITKFVFVLFVMAGADAAFAGFNLKVHLHMPPVVTTQPFSQVVYEGQSATFTVAAIGISSLSYQWMESVNGGAYTNIEGATSASYTTSANTVLNNGAQFECVVSDGLGGSVTSNAAALTVNPALTCPTVVPTSSLVVNVKDTGAKGDGTNDDLAAIQAAIDQVNRSGGGTVYVPDGTYMLNVNAVNNGIVLHSNTTFSLSSGAVLKVMTPNNASNYSVIDIVNVSNVNVIGGTLIGDKYYHGNTSGEFGYGILIEGATNVVVEGVTASEFWGDGFIVGGTKSNPTSTNTTFCGVTSNNNRRQGISLGSANGITIDNSIFENNNGTAPQCGMDVEPNPLPAINAVNNLQVQNSIFENNYGAGICLNPDQANAIITGSINNNVIMGNNGGMVFNGNSDRNVSGYTITNNTINDSNSVGIQLLLGSNNHTVTGNTITVAGNAYKHGILDQSNGGGPNTIYANDTNLTDLNGNVFKDNVVTNITTPVNYPLTINLSGNGTVSESPDSATYPQGYPSGTPVTLTAVPSSGYQFSGWTGVVNQSAGKNPLKLTMTANTNVLANFSQTETISTNPGTGGAINAVCGTANTTYAFGTTSFGSDTLCAQGNPSPATVAFPGVGRSVSWTCQGVNGGADSSCGAAQKPKPKVIFRI